jgi:hypothetical protein
VTLTSRVVAGRLVRDAGHTGRIRGGQKEAVPTWLLGTGGHLRTSRIARSEYLQAGTAQIPKLIVRVR